MDYSRFLTRRERVRIWVESVADSCMAHILSTVNGFNFHIYFERATGVLRKTLPEDLDERLMALGDHYWPTARLDNLVNKVNRWGYCGITPYQVMQEYFRQYYTYQKVYKKVTQTSKQAHGQP